MQTEPRAHKITLVLAWATILIGSLFKIIAQEIFRLTVSDNLNLLVVLSITLIGFALSFLWSPARPLRPFYILFIVLFGTQWFVYTRLDRLSFYQEWLNHPSFSVSMLAEQSLNLIVTLAMIIALFLLRGSRQRFFLQVGDTAAPAEPVGWLGMKPGETWKRHGRIFAFFISLGTLAFLVIAGRPSLDGISRALPFLPAILLAATLNAFNEEMTYKASFLAVLEDVVGKRQALYLMAALFGIFHFYGVPYGVIGVVMATFLGWLLGKSMLETRGLFWAWFIHFLQDVLIFIFLAIGLVTAGGK